CEYEWTGEAWEWQQSSDGVSCNTSGDPELDCECWPPCEPFEGSGTGAGTRTSGTCAEEDPCPPTTTTTCPPCSSPEPCTAVYQYQEGEGWGLATDACGLEGPAAPPPSEPGDQC